MREQWGSRFRLAFRHTDAVLAAGVIGIILLLIIPLPPIFLDAFVCLSIVLSVMVLLLTIYVENALEFSAFPSVLLFLTLFRLGLNIASTRMILTRAEAGDLIRTFGKFVTGGDIFVGFILFMLLTLINFIVITKGAGRIAEVAARFTLEALPGKQMAIDGEFSSGLITQMQAKEERKKLSAETDFFGSMDGASKFVKGDAVVGLVITVVNILGGLVVGLAIKGMPLHECFSTVTLLTVGDGLVSQIPALLVSVGAAIMVSRSSVGSIGKTMPAQLFHQPKVLIFSAATLLILSLVPGMPKMVMIPLSLLILWIGYVQLRSKTEKVEEKREVHSLLVPPLEIQLGYQVVLLAEPLKERTNEIRQKIALHLGVCIPSVKISDQVNLPPTGWEILVKGVRMASGRDAELAFLVSKLSEIIELHAYELINRQVVAQMIQEVKKYDSAVVDELLGKKMSTGQILKVLQNLLKERVSIRDFVTILEILADHASGEVTDIETLTEKVRWGLARGISEKFFGKNHRAHVITIDPKVEEILSISKSTLRPKTIDQLSKQVFQLNQKAQAQGISPVVITATSSRLQLKKIIERQLPNLPVLSFREIAPDVELQSIGMVSNEVLI